MSDEWNSGSTASCVCDMCGAELRACVRPKTTTAHQEWLYTLNYNVCLEKVRTTLLQWMCVLGCGEWSGVRAFSVPSLTNDKLRMNRIEWIPRHFNVINIYYCFVVDADDGGDDDSVLFVAWWMIIWCVLCTVSVASAQSPTFGSVRMRPPISNE